jgi:hypothetical protein
LEYGDMMQVYAEVAGLRPRRILVLPVLTPRIASLWVGFVTPIPAGLARPLVESLHCDAVMGNHDIDTIIAPPEGGLTPYRRSVSLALARIARGEVETTWNTGTAAQLPSDPEWAGEVVYTDTRALHTTASPDQLWKAVESSLPKHWKVEEREPGLIKLRSARNGPGDRWLEVRITPEGSGSRYEQRAIFYPRGLVGRAYWYAGRPLQAVALDRRVKKVTSAVR